MFLKNKIKTNIPINNTITQPIFLPEFCSLVTSDIKLASQTALIPLRAIIRVHL